jgi:hypothetical protein
MALQKQTVTIPIGKGLNSKADPRLLQPPAMATVTNGRFLKTGQIRKRFGNVQVTPAALPTNTPHTLWVHKNQPVVLTDDELLRYNATENRYRELVSLTGSNESGICHPMVPLSVTSVPLVRQIAEVTQQDCAINGDGSWICYAWTQADKLFVRIDELATGNTALGPIELAAAGITTWGDCRVGFAKNTAIVVGWDAGTGLYMWSSDTTASPLEFTGATDLSSGASHPFDLATDTASEVARLVCYVDVPTGARFRSINTAAAVTDNVTDATVQCDAVVRLIRHYGAQVLWCAWYEQGTPNPVQYATFDVSYTQLTGVHSVLNKAGTSHRRIDLIEHSSSQCWVITEELRAAGTTETRLQFAAFNAAGAIQTQAIAVENIRLVGKGFFYLGRPWWLVAYEHPPYDTTSKPSVDPLDTNRRVIDPPQPRAFLVTPYSYTTAGAQGYLAAVATCLVDLIRDAAAVWTHSAIVKDPNANTFHAVAAVFGATEDSQGIQHVTFTMPGDPLPVEVHSGLSVLAGGQLWTYDGDRAEEVQPHWAPEGPTVAAGAGGSIDDGLHYYRIVWEWEDSAGNIHRSAPSRVSQITITAPNSTATLTFPDLTIRTRDGTHAAGVRVAVYRTKVGGTVYYLATRAVPSAAATAGMVDVDDTAIDSAIDVNEVLYTEGGVLQNDPPPPFRDIVRTKGRLWGLHAERAGEIWYSKYLQPSVAPEFSAAFVLQLPQGSGVALERLDDKTIIFTEAEIYAVHGDGPADTGVQNNFVGPRLVSADMGCENRGSVVRCPAGVCFQSKRGIQLLDRNEDVRYIGAPVEDELGSGTVYAAIHFEKQQEVRFYLDGSANALVWNYLHDAWALWDGHTMQCPTAWDDYGLYAETDGKLLQETDGTFLDQGSFFALSLVTPWIKPAGIQGFVRVWRALLLGEHLEAHAARVQIAYDYVDTWVDTYSWTESELDTLIASQPYQLAVKPSRQKCQAIRFEVLDQSSETDGEGFALSGITLEAGIKRGAQRVAQGAYK